MPRRPSHSDMGSNPFDRKVSSSTITSHGGGGNNDNLNPGNSGSRNMRRHNGRTTRANLQEKDSDVIMKQNNDTQDNDEQNSQNEDDSDEDEDEETSLRRLSETYMKSRSASYLMDQSDDDEDDDGEDQSHSGDIVAQESAHSYSQEEQDYDIDSEGDEMMRSVEGALNRAVQNRQRRTRSTTTNNNPLRAEGGSLEDAFEEVLGNTLTRHMEHRQDNDNEESDQQDGDEIVDDFQDIEGEEEQTEERQNDNADTRGTDSAEDPRNYSRSRPAQFGRGFDGAFRAAGVPGSLAEAIGGLLPEAFLFGGAGGGMGNTPSIAHLLENIQNHEDPYMLLENLNVMSETILMMNGMVAERSIPAYKLSQALVDILQDPSLQEDLELQLVACRCMYNVLAVSDDFANGMVSCGAIEALQSKLLEISYIDLAEQALQTLEMISKVRGRDIMNKNCLSSVLEYLDFFTIHSQRKALIITANSSQNLSIDSFDKVKQIFPIIERVAIEYSDPISVENAWMTISRMIQSFKRRPDLCEVLISDNLLKRLSIILPASCGRKNSSNNLLTFATCIKCLNSLTILANTSSKLSVMIIKSFNLGEVIVSSLANYSTNSIAPSSSDLASADKNVNVEDLTQTDSLHHQVSIESLMAAPKQLILIFIKLIGYLLPYVESPTPIDSFYEITVGGFMSSDDNEIKINIKEEKISIYKVMPEISNIFVADFLPLLSTIYSSTVDYDIRRIVLVDLYRLVNFLYEQDSASQILNANITNLLASIVIQSKTYIRRELTAFKEEDEQGLRNILLKGSSKSQPYVLLLGAFLITEKLSKREEFINQFEREGLMSDTAALLEILRIDGRIIHETLDQGQQMEHQRERKSHVQDEAEDEDNDVDDDDDDDDGEDDDEEDDDDDDEEEDDEDEDDEDNELIGEEGEYNEDDEHSQDDTNIQEDSSNRNRAIELTRDKKPSFRSHIRSYDDNALTFDALSIGSLPQILSELVKISSNIEKQYLELRANGPNSRLEHMRLLDEICVILQNRDKSTRFSYADWLSLWKSFANSLEDRIDKSSSISSFELISSGIIESLLSLFRSPVAAEGTPCYTAFQMAFCEISFDHHNQTDVPIIVLVNKFQEALTRSESFEITTSGCGPVSYYGGSGYSGYSGSSSSPSSDANNRAAVMAKQIKLRLVCDDSSMPEGSRQMLMTVHALGTFRAISTFLKNRLQTLSQLSRFGSFAAMRRTAESSGAQSGDTNGQDDFHIDFSVEDESIPEGTTIYGAIHRLLQKGSSKAVDPKNIWNVIHEIKIRKVDGFKEPEQDEEWYPYDAYTDEAEVLKDSTTLNILDCLKMLFNMNMSVRHAGVSAALFINFKLTAKLNRQLEEPLAVSSGTLPDWSIYITRNYPFLFPIETRMFFLQSTSFGHSRLIQAWEQRTNQNEGGQNSQVSLGRPSRHKIRIARNNLFECALKVMKLYSSIPSLIEIEYFDEVGTGLGPTLEFYAGTSKAFSMKKRHMWREDEEDSPYIHYKSGLFPSPMDEQLASSKQGHSILQLFSALGSFVARALLDSRIIDFRFNPLFFKIVNEMSSSSRGGFINHNKSGNMLSLLHEVRLVDLDLYKSLKHLLKYVEHYSEGADNDSVIVDGALLEDLSLTYTLPGYHSIELIPQGADTMINASSIEQYISSVIDFTVGSGIRRQAEAFIDGFSKVFPYTSMTIFSPEELVILFGNGEEDWSMEVLRSSIRADHGYNSESSAIKYLLEIMTEFTKEEKRKFLQFLTGSPRLPIGGFKNLRPDLTVVKKDSEQGLIPDDYLPSVMTCANYLKLPNYSSKELMKQRLIHAFSEGSDSFMLS